MIAINVSVAACQLPILQFCSFEKKRSIMCIGFYTLVDVALSVASNGALARGFTGRTHVVYLSLTVIQKQSTRLTE